ncbi:MAG: hypothetical protein JKY60_17880 [Kordiimonadaceae bacterium]|nr:hypothetical protein [Kordiimonadaceae bacterium]
MAVLHFFRIEIFQNQTDILLKWPGANKILRDATRHFPNSNSDRRTIHFVTHFENVDKNGCYFQIARRGKKVTEELDVNEEYIELEHTDILHTRVILDHEISLLVVEHNNSYTKDLNQIPRRIANWILNYQRKSGLDYRVMITPIKNPNSLIFEIKNANLVRRFFFDVKRKNIFDTAQMARDIKKYTTAINGESTRTQTTGTNMDKDTMIEIIRSSASTGDDAGALLIPHGSRKHKRLSLGKNLLRKDVSDETTAQPRSFLEYARSIYENIRNR